MNKQEFQIELTQFLAERLLTGELALRREIPPPPFRGLGKHAERSAQRYYKSWQKVSKKVERQARVRLERDCECVILNPGATWRAFIAGRRAMSWQVIHQVIRAVCNIDHWIDKGSTPGWGPSEHDYSKAGRRKVRHRLIKKARENPAAAVQDWLMTEIMDFKHRHEIAFVQFFESDFYHRVQKLEAELDELLALAEDDPMEIRRGLLHEVLEPAFKEVE